MPKAGDSTTTPPRTMNASSTEGWVKKGRRNQREQGMGGPAARHENEPRLVVRFSPCPGRVSFAVGIEGGEKGPNGRPNRYVTKTNYDKSRSSFFSIPSPFSSLTFIPNARVTNDATTKTRRRHKERRHATPPTMQPMSPPSEGVGYAVTRRNHPTAE
jgi:hypothetical protein